jgi:hypothetical protein
LDADDENATLLRKILDVGITAFFVDFRLKRLPLFLQTDHVGRLEFFEAQRIADDKYR